MMPSFKSKIAKLEESSAYCMGVKAFYHNINSCPFEYGSEAFNEWYEGFADAAYLHKIIYED